MHQGKSNLIDVTKRQQMCFYFGSLANLISMFINFSSFQFGPCACVKLLLLYAIPLCLARHLLDSMRLYLICLVPFMCSAGESYWSVECWITGNWLVGLFVGHRGKAMSLWACVYPITSVAKYHYNTINLQLNHPAVVGRSPMSLLMKLRFRTMFSQLD